MEWIFSEPSPGDNVFSKKLIRYFILFLLLATQAQSLAQDTLFYTEKMRFEKDSRTITNISDDGNRIITIEETSGSDDRLHFFIHDQNGRLIEKFNFSFPNYNDIDLDLSHVRYIRSKLYLFSTGYSRKTNTLYGFVFSLENQQLTPVIQLHSLKTSFRSDLGTQLSPDSTKILVYFEQSEVPRSSDYVSLRVYGVPDFEPVWDRELSLPYEKEVLQINQFRLDNFGSVYMMSGKKIVKNNQPIQRTQGARYVVFYYDNESNRLKEFDISLKDKQVVSAIGVIDENNQMLVGGYYSNDYNFAVAGTFLFVISEKAAQITTAAYMAFSKEFLSGYMSDRELDRSPELTDLYLDQLLIANDSSLWFIGEQFYITERISSDINTGRTIVENVSHFDDIIVSKISIKDGKIKWTSKIPKAQYSSIDLDRCGYSLFSKENELHFFFNDHPDNFIRLQQKPNALPEGWNGSRVAVITKAVVDINGKTKRNALVATKTAGGPLLPGLGNERIFGLPVLGIYEGKEYRFCIPFAMKK